MNLKRALFFTCASVWLAAAAPAGEVLSFGRFGDVFLYPPPRAVAHVALFVSGDGGWNLGVVDMARAVAEMDTLVVGIDITRYLRRLESGPEACSYPAADFEMLSKFVQKTKNLPDYIAPHLIGYSSGATLVYALLAEAPPSTFAGAISLGFCPDLPLRKPFCKGYGLEWTPGPKGKGVLFQPARQLAAPWIAFQGLIDQVCDAAATRAYVAQVGNASLVELEHVGHGFSKQKNWLPQFQEAYRRLTAPPPAPPSPPPAAVDGLPLVEVRPDAWQGDSLAVVVSGDGGWAAIDRSIGDALAARGVGVVGFNSLKYFWKRRTPEQAGADLQRLLDHYLGGWKKSRALLIGYSLGADVLPFMVNRLRPDTRARIHLLALLGPSREVDFEFHLNDWLGSPSHAGALPVKPELERLRGLKLLCFYGADETDSLCSGLEAGLAQCIRLGGGHHFGGDYEGITATILAAAGR